jgi:hypothetical protein
MKLSLHALLLLLTLALVPSAFAADEPSSHGQQWRQIIDNLTNSGITRLGSLDLTAFRAEAEGVHWFRLDSAPATVLSGSRSSAYYLKGKLTVYMQEQLPAEALAALPQLELHEAFGAVGYDDNDTSKSTALALLSRMPEGMERNRLASAYGRSLFAPAALARGGTSVSGGGDLATLYAKAEILRTVMGGYGNQAHALIEFLEKYPSVDFEPLRAGGERTVVIQYRYTPARETFSVFLPMERWKEGESARAQLVQEAARKLLELFPAYAGAASRTFTPSGCPAGKQVTYPATDDQAVKDIQNVRGEMQLGCMEYQHQSGFTAKMIQAPAVAAPAQPKEAGNFYYSCTFSLSGRPVSIQQFTVRAGSHPLLSNIISIQEGDNIEGMFAVLPDGRMEFVEIAYHDPQGNGPQPHPARSADGSGAETHVDNVDGQRLDFSCHKVETE